MILSFAIDSLQSEYDWIDVLACERSGEQEIMSSETKTSLIFLGVWFGRSDVDNARHAALNFVQTVCHEVDEQVKHESSEEAQLHSSDRIGQKGHIIMGALQLILTECGSESINRHHRVLVKQVDRKVGKKARDESDCTEELSSLLTFFRSPTRAVAGVVVRIYGRNNLRCRTDQGSPGTEVDHIIDPGD